ncbi:Ribonuclease P [Handroanthus impetiginosus]|uniref:Ribonuclease P n=1 Tax=Handroanthus impetiginosus TaxID=429701 RepID=A0A2G9HJX0_9LAMI|nr:Ribonuclease P [Handroanthus impetiginosus]
MVTNGSKAGVSAAPPHELTVWKFAEARAPELESLHSILADRLDNNFQSQKNKRRRTTGHDDRVAKRKFKRRKAGVGDMCKTDSERKDESKVSRRVRRNIELKKNPPCGFGTSGDGTKRLRTHVWHAKRFTMTKLWGFHVPLGLNGRGKGSRALLKKLKNGVLVHDASYYGCVQLEGPEDALLLVLSSVLVPPPSTCCEGISHDILAGHISGTAMLHDSGKPGFSPIAPVTFMWRPQQRFSTNTEGFNIDSFHIIQNINDGTASQLWVWIHAAACEEAYAALLSACERQTGITGPVNCISREGQLEKLELIGSKVFELMQKTLLPTSCSENSYHQKKCVADRDDDHGLSEETSILENGNQIPSSAVISLVVKDPRTLTKKGNVIIPEGKPLGLLSYEHCETKEQSFSSLPKHEAECVFNYGDLWDANKGVSPPVEESILCMEKHQQRKEFICLGSKSSVSQNAIVDGKYSRVCPVMLLKNENHEDSVTRWSIILPLSWVKAFWITLMSNGAHAIGLRERQWVACEIGLPYFPLDFPDCNAYSHFMAVEAIAFNHKATLRPHSKMPLQVPIPPPWDCVRFNFEERLSKAGNSHSGDSQAELCSQGDKIDNCHGVSFDGIIARTSSMLSDFLNNSGNHLLLFPKLRDQKSRLYEFMKDKEFLEKNAVISEPKHGNTRCYLRVLLRACKEGVFEQGAVVCAPLVTDIMLWKSRSESDEQQLQIPQSLLKSYFMQSPSGKWELQIPEDLALREFYRWPIGFITTGFVRGSKKATAGAVCEASLLSKLRVEQWKALPVRQRRKETYVLVRNMRSTAYRLALATIVLEQEEEDITFL